MSVFTGINPIMKSMLCKMKVNSNNRWWKQFCRKLRSFWTFNSSGIQKQFNLFY